MRVPLYLLSIAFASPSFGQSQTSSGDCSPNILTANDMVVINCFNGKEKTPTISIVNYEVVENGYSDISIFATVEGLRYRVHEMDYGLAWIVAQEDFDNDGFSDALVGWSCGGNACPSTYSVVSYRGKGVFKVAEHDKYWSWVDPEIIQDGLTFLMRVDSVLAGVGSIAETSEMNIFSFERGELHIVESGIAKAEVPSIIELRSDIFKNGEVSKEKSVAANFDLNNDKIKDSLICRWWERWGLLSCLVELSSGEKIGISNGCNRLGILTSSTNGLNDLVCDRDNILKFNDEAMRYD